VDPAGLLLRLLDLLLLFVTGDFAPRGPTLRLEFDAVGG
jgi:hypothetical protein